MSTTKTTYTPGEWRADKETGDGGGTSWVVTSDSRITIADCGWYAHIGFGRADDSENEANARLIAAAPDLLAALKRLLNDADDDGITVTEEGIDQARAAIAKAEGTESGNP